MQTLEGITLNTYKGSVNLYTEMPTLERIELGGVRHYICDGLEDPVPSVTSVLSVLEEKKKALNDWRERVGDEEAAKIMHRASVRGTAAHEMIEDYVQSKLTFEGRMPNQIDLFTRLRDVTDAHIDNIRMIEGQMYSKHLRVAGTVDMIAEFDGVMSVIDWKTSIKPKRREWITNYFMQESAYAVMFEETTGIPVSQLVTVVSCESGDTQVFIEKRDTWINEFIEARKLFDQQYGHLLSSIA
jgi:genome maintenance exonuclease 1